MIDVLKSDYQLRDIIIPVAEGIDLVPSGMPNANLDNIILINRLPINKVLHKPIQEIRTNYDLVLIDCPPALGASVSSAALAADTIIAPVTPEEFSIDGLKVSPGGTHQSHKGLRCVL
jgi:chromosome partitioning protein